MNKTEVDRFEKLSGQLTSVYEEMSLLSKKNSNDAVNKFKLQFVNKLIGESNEFLASKYRPFEDFNRFDEDDVPQTSDVVFIVSQYIQCFEKLRSDNVVLEYGSWFWKVKGEKGDNVDIEGMVKIRTVKPRTLKN